MRYRSLRRTSGPDVEPVSVEDAKLHLRVDSETDDLYIAGLISAAREWCEVYTDRTLIHTQLAMTMDTFPLEIELPKPPVAVAAGFTTTVVTFAQESGGTATLPTTDYRVDRTSEPGVIRNIYAGTWPSHLIDQNSITVTWFAGYGADGAKVPKVVKSAILMLVGFWFERRLAADQVASTEVPFGVKAMLDSIKWGSYR